MVDWHSLRQLGSKTAFSVASEEAIYTHGDTTETASICVLFNEKTERINDMGVIEHRPTARVRVTDFPFDRPNAWDVLTFRDHTWTVDFWESSKNGLEWLIYLKDTGYGQAN